MPTHTVHSALADMFFNDDGAPWKYRTWQQLTGIMHGLFSPNDDELPPPWTRKESNHVLSYHQQFRAKGTQDAKIKFAASRKGSAQVPGRSIFGDLVTDIWKRKGIHAIITSILTAHSAHPVQIARASRSGTLSLTNLPNGKEYAPEVVDPVGLRLFGIECLDKDGVHVDSSIRGDVRVLIMRTWINIRNQTSRSLKRIVKCEEEAVQAFQDLEKESKPTKAMVKAVIIKVARWKVLAHALSLDDHIAKVTPMDERLLALMFSLGAKPVKASEKRKAAAIKRNDALVKVLLSEGDLDDIFHLYRDFFDNTSPADSIDLADQHATIAAQFGLNKGVTIDLGMGVESALTIGLLAHNLGYEGVLPLLFNNYCHTAGLSAWDTDHEHLFVPEAAQVNPDMAVLSLHWHQIAGVHAVVNMNFTSTPDTRPTGCLIADEVGLGKTFLCAAIIAFFCDIVNQQTMMKHPDPAVRAVVRLPPILKNKPYLGTSDVLPKLCHLILVPGTLLIQWTEALQTVFKPRRIEIMEYPSDPNERVDFWKPGSPFHASIAGSNVILLASHSTMTGEYGELCTWSKPSASDPDKLPWTSYKKRADYSKFLAGTLFGQKYLSVTLDEAQSFRNVGLRHCAALAILELAVFRMPMTATPIQTSTKDAASMGRLLGIPHFLTRDAFSEERDDSSVLRQVQRPANDVENDSDNQNPEVLEAQTAIVTRMQGHFENRILRRTRNSLDCDGKKLIDLPPCIDISLIVKPTPREMEIITQHANNVKESASSANGVLQICSKDFYLSHRMCIAYARADLAEKIPHFNSLEEWEPTKSTKFDVCARLCKHILSRDDAPEVEIVDGQVVYPPLPPLEPGVAASRTTKILISQSYPSLGSLLRNILDLHGVKYLYIDGRQSFEKRAKTVSQFINDPEYRVLIMSSVGSVGLNLTVANVIIFVDQVWSAQDELQIRGRAHRQPQKKTVRCFHILADETADIVLAALARGKHHMMEAFLSQQEGRDLMATIRGQTIAEPEDDYDDEHDPPDLQERRKKPQKTTRKKKKATVVVASDEDVPSASSQYKSAPTPNTVPSHSEDERFHQGASPVRGEEDTLPYRDSVSSFDNMTDDTAGSANTSNRDDDTSGTDDIGATQRVDDDSDFEMGGPSITEAMQESISTFVKTPPRQENKQKEARSRSIIPDSPEQARNKKRIRTAASAVLVDYPSSPTMDVDEDVIPPMRLMWTPSDRHGNSANSSSIAEADTRNTRQVTPLARTSSAPSRPSSSAPPKQLGARQASPHTALPSASAMPRPLSAAALGPRNSVTQPPSSALSGAPGIRRAHSLATLGNPVPHPTPAAAHEPQDARRALHSSSTSRPGSVPSLHRPGSRRASLPRTEVPNIDPETSVTMQDAASPPVRVADPVSNTLPRPTPASDKSAHSSEHPALEERRTSFLKPKATHSQNDINRFQHPNNLGRSSSSVPTPKPTSRVASQRHTTLTKGGSTAKLVIPEASTKSKNPFSSRKTMEGK